MPGTLGATREKPMYLVIATAEPFGSKGLWESVACVRGWCRKLGGCIDTRKRTLEMICIGFITDLCLSDELVRRRNEGLSA